MPIFFLTAGFFRCFTLSSARVDRNGQESNQTNLTPIHRFRFHHKSAEPICFQLFEARLGRLRNRASSTQPIVIDPMADRASVVFILPKRDHCCRPQRGMVGAKVTQADPGHSNILRMVIPKATPASILFLSAKPEVNTPTSPIPNVGEFLSGRRLP